MHTALKQSHRTPHLRIDYQKKMLCYQLFSTHYTAVRINNYSKRTFAIKVATMKITDDYIEVITCLPQNRHFFVVNKDEWHTKEGHGKSMKNPLHVQQYGKRHLSG